MGGLKIPGFCHDNKQELWDEQEHGYVAVKPCQFKNNIV